MKRKLVYVYGILCYGIFLVTFLYMIGFVGNLLVPKSVDSGSPGAFWPTLGVDLGLIALFGLQHSLMSRRKFKKKFRQYIPRYMERSTYVLLSCLTLGLIFWGWRPLPSLIWEVKRGWLRWLMWGVFGSGWMLVFISARMINSGHLFGLQQVKSFMKGEQLRSPEFQTPGFYRYVRHPLMLSFLIAFWAGPTMTLGHLVFALSLTLYILIGIHFEERALMKRFGDRYRRYRSRVPMLIPGLNTSRPE